MFPLLFIIIYLYNIIYNNCMHHKNATLHSHIWASFPTHLCLKWSTISCKTLRALANFQSHGHSLSVSRYILHPLRNSKPCTSTWLVAHKNAQCNFTLLHIQAKKYCQKSTLTIDEPVELKALSLVLHTSFLKTSHEAIVVTFVHTELFKKRRKQWWSANVWGQNFRAKCFQRKLYTCVC